MDVLDAKPFIVFVALSTCFKLKLIDSLAGIAMVVAIDTSFKSKVYDPLEAEVFAITISVTSVVVAAGTVYNVAELVAAAALDNTLNVVAIL
jgi:hypothetical protein